MNSYNRVGYIDALRGFAILGILIGNLPVFSGLAMLSQKELAQLGDLETLNSLYLNDIFVKAKFYSIFSLLFGIGFILQQKRYTENFTNYHHRRMGILLAIGFLHAFLFWFGDILMLYALLGFTLVWFNRLSDKELLFAALLLLFLPVFIYFIYLGTDFSDPLAAYRDVENGVNNSMRKTYQNGNYLEIFAVNAQYVAGRWAYIFINLRIPRVLGMFVLGMYLMRSGHIYWLLDSQNRSRVLILSLLLLFSGVLLNFFYIDAYKLKTYLPASISGLKETIYSVIAVPLLSLGYVYGLAFFYGFNRIIPLEWLGQMPLSNYVFQTLICVCLFYGYGFGMYGKLDYISVMKLGVLIVAFQFFISYLVIKKYGQGPLEVLWRKLSLGKKK